jgi:hypothetical protein
MCDEHYNLNCQRAFTFLVINRTMHVDFYPNHPSTCGILFSFNSVVKIRLTRTANAFRFNVLFLIFDIIISFQSSNDMFSFFIVAKFCYCATIAGNAWGRKRGHGKYGNCRSNRRDGKRGGNWPWYNRRDGSWRNGCKRAIISSRGCKNRVIAVKFLSP